MSPMTAPVAADAAGIVTLVFAVLAAVRAHQPSPPQRRRVLSRQDVALLVQDRVEVARGAHQGAEQRILELVAETEERALAGAKAEDSGWTLMPRSWTFTTTVAMAWLPVGTKALALVRQRA
ncbi:hypothetical protein EV126DRAFT_511640 [Verticillium dahliae]|uniref:Uncharacterized protein n=1 Tax=Verticillium dahliae TaxID=27337 RepID=A0A444RJM4_VERDA|nr:hypothetical protein VdG2_00112 [Verticillium dahliae VDG2]KAH6708649.1 hypothetical protein EV126DRAFT_511640 [Verticillium dahliae]RXG41327.1 hypothetical protein VDGE_20393 [Verticillium dahliae]